MKEIGFYEPALGWHITRSHSREKVDSDKDEDAQERMMNEKRKS